MYHQSQDEARAARIQKYKEDRRKQLTARTAVLFSDNVTDRKHKKSSETISAEDEGFQLKSSLDLNINTAALPIRTTRASRLRAAAVASLDPVPNSKKTNRSSSVTCLVEDLKSKNIARSSKPLDTKKYKPSTNRKNSQEEKENFKGASSSSFVHKDVGATILKPKHSISKNTSGKTSYTNLNQDTVVDVGEDVKPHIAQKDKRDKDASLCINKKRNSKSIENNIDVKLQNSNNANVYDNLEIVIKTDDENSPFQKVGKTEVISLNNDLIQNQINKPLIENSVITDKKEVIVKLNGNSSSVPVVVLNDVAGCELEAGCVRKVERFSELLSNLCSPCEADTLFEDILVDNGLEGEKFLRPLSPARAPPSRRIQTPNAAGSPSMSTCIPQKAGCAAKNKRRQSHEFSPAKTETALRSSRIISKVISSPYTNNEPTLSNCVTSGPPTNSSNNSNYSNKAQKNRNSPDNSNKPSYIPLSRKSTDRNPKPASTPPKQNLVSEDINHKHTPGKRRSYEEATESSNRKVRSDCDNTRITRKYRAQIESESPKEKYQHSSKRLTSLENNIIKDEVIKTSPKRLINDCTESKTISANASDILVDSNNIEDMSILHETVRPHSSRLSQEMDTLAALTKQTLDRVNKLSSNKTHNLVNSKLNYDTSHVQSGAICEPSPEKKDINDINENAFACDRLFTNRGVTERLKDIDTAAQRLIDFEKQSAIFSDLNNDISSQNRRSDSPAPVHHTPVSILKRKSIHEDCANSYISSHAIPSPPVTFSPSVVEPRNSRSENRLRQGILKKRRSLDESQVSRRRSCSPEVSFAEDGSLDMNKSILKNRRSSLEDVVRNHSPDGHIQGILKRKLSKDEDQFLEDNSQDSPEPHGILKRKSNSSSSSSTTSSHVSIAQAVLLAAAGGAEIVDDDKEIVRPILKKKSFSEERPCLETLPSEIPRPILKKKSTDLDDHEFDRPKKPILKSSKKLSSDEGNTSSFDLSEEDRSSRRSSLLKSRTSDHSGSECETTVRPILKQRGSSLTRDRSQSPRPRLSFCADNDANISIANFSSEANDSSTAGPSRIYNATVELEERHGLTYSSAVLRRRDLRPKNIPRSKSLACDVNEELLSILNSRRMKVDENCDNNFLPWNPDNREEETNCSLKTFPSIATRIKHMEEVITKDVSSSKESTPRLKTRDRDRYKTQPITVEEMWSATSSLEPSQQSFQPFDTAGIGSFPSHPVADTVKPIVDLSYYLGESENSRPYDINDTEVPLYPNRDCINLRAEIKEVNGYKDAPFLGLENIPPKLERRKTLEEIEREVDKVRVALDEDCRALDEDERQQAEAENWSLNVSCDSGVYNRASSRDSGPHSGEELGLVECQEIRENHEANSTSNNWSPQIMEKELFNMERQRTSTDGDDAKSPEQVDDDDTKNDNCIFDAGLMKSNSVVARANMWQQLQQQAKGTPRQLIHHNRSKTKMSPTVVVDRIKNEANQSPVDDKSPLNQSKSSANILDRDEDAKLDEDDPAKLSLMEKMKMFNAKLSHKPPVAGLPKGREERASRSARLKTMPVLSSQVQEALEHNERLSKSLTHEEVPKNTDFQMKMELFRSASLKNTSIEYVKAQNAKNKRLGTEDASLHVKGHQVITPGVRGILKSGETTDKPMTLAKGESSEGLKDEGIDSSSDDDSSSASSMSSSEKSCSSSDSSEESPGSKPKRFALKAFQKNKLKSSRTDSDLTRVLRDPYPRKVQLPCMNEMKDRLNKENRFNKENKLNKENTENKVSLLGKIHRPVEEKREENEDLKNIQTRRLLKKVEEPLQLGKLRRSTEIVQNQTEAPAPILKISAMNRDFKNKFFGIDTTKKERSMDELAAAVRKYIPQVNKSVSTHAMAEVGGSGSDGESSGGREVRHINSRTRYRGGGGGGVQRSATHAEMPHRGGTIAERLAALQAAGANDWRARVCRLSPEREDTKAIERVKNRINDTITQTVDEKKKVQIDDNELGSNILAERRNKLETAAQGWRKRVPQNDANLFTVAGRLERDKVSPATPPQRSSPPMQQLMTPIAQMVASPGIPTPNKFRSRKQPSSPPKLGSGPLRSASCAVVSAASVVETSSVVRSDRDSFKRSHSVSESFNRLDEEEEKASGAEKSGSAVRVPRADDETFHAFFTPASSTVLGETTSDLLSSRTPQEDLDLDAIDSGSRQLLSSEYARRARRERRKAASRNPLRTLAARTDLRDEYSPPPSTGVKEKLTKEKIAGNCGLAAEALAALASKEDFANVSLRSAAMPVPASQATKPLMLLHIKGRRRVQTRLVEPMYTSVNRGDCFILVTQEQLFLYMGLYSNVIERSRSSDIALHIQSTKDLGYKNSANIITLDEQAKSFNNNHWNQFWSLLGVSNDKDDYKPIEAGHHDEDEIYESCIIHTNMCYELLDDELVPIKDYWGQVPKIAMLNPSKVVIFDFGSELYIWYGKNVPLERRRHAAQLAQELFDDGYNYEDCNINPLNAAIYQGNRVGFEPLVKTSKTRPDWTILSKVTQHMESILFREKFLDWPDFTRVIKVKNHENKSNGLEISPCDAEEMYSNEYQDPDLVLEGSHIGRGTHYYDKETMRHFDIKTKSVSKWIIREYDYQKVEEESELGEFFSADSYIIRWEYQITVTGRELNGKPSKHNMTGRDRCAYFCWQGKDASPNEKGAAALLTVELDKEKGPQVRVAQGNEPPAFLNLFQGNLVVHQGKRGSDGRYKLFITRGNLSNESCLVQVPCSMRQLRSRGSLLLIDTEKGCLYIWHGSRSLKHTKSVAIDLANKLIARKSSYLFGAKASDVRIMEIKEGEESKEVLDALGANKQYYSSVLNSGHREVAPDVTPRIFHFTDLGGQFEANEVLSPLRHEHLVTPFPFEQKELYSASQPALFLIDDGATLWLWQGWWPRNEDGELEPAERSAGVGAFAARWHAMRAAALRTAKSYWFKAHGESTRPDVRVVAAGLEPAAFTDLFDTWIERDDAAEANIAHGYKAGETLCGGRELSRLTSCDAVLPLAALQQRPLPEQVDPHHLERHLATPDFLEAFGMTKDEFSVLPSWKQANLKKDLGLF